ncbi:MAG: asparagine synthase (glutamine-hydrolyzing) [Candidatus Cloacimonadota bacterium]|nr:MAG: asparagine synthase (glutamine-hydrolyzing) [Candidatus Cloacimonadota bacterium]
MCGITGYIDFKSQLKNKTLSILKQMTDAIIHRGPDADGHFICTQSRVALGHRRLSILDLSEAGAQPMTSKSQRYIIVFNGEIYNFKDLRKDLEGVSWRGHSDTEVLLEYIEQFGFEKTLTDLNGMFAISLYDKKENKLYLARDRAGEKPLYYGQQGDFFFFGSELKSFLKHPNFNNEVDRDVLCSYLRHNYIPAPLSIYKNISKLQPGTFVEVDINSQKVLNKYYWNPQEKKASTEIFLGTEQEAKSKLNDLLLDAVKIRMESDVPLGAFLSGGVDSSLIVALMQAQSKKKVQTFTIGFEEDQYNEAKFAQDVANHLKTDHTEMYVTSKQTLDVIPNLAKYWDEPFADSSQVPTYLVSQVAKQKVTVCLSGDGGDELFSGYDRYFWSENIWSKLKKIPKGLKSIVGNTLSNTNPKTLDFLYSCIKPIFPKKLQFSNFSGKIAKLAPALSSNTVQDLYYLLLSHWSTPQNIVIGGIEKLNIVKRIQDSGFNADIIEWNMFCDLNNYLPDDILTKVDRASMAVSLEGRIPLLDHRVIEFSWSLPREMRVKNGVGKHLLRSVLYDYVPQSLIDRPKKGFGVPIDMWLKGPLKDWACDLLSKDRIVRDGYFKPEPIIEKLNQHLNGVGAWHYYLWDILMFQLWLDEQKKA